MEIRDQSGDRDNFTMVPNFIFRLGLSPYAVTLYGYIKQAAGETGRCFKSTTTIASELSMSAGSVSAAKIELEKNGLIQIDNIRRAQGGKPYHSIAILDVWQRNAEFIATHKRERSLGEQANSSDEIATSQGEIIKNPSINNPESKSDAKIASPCPDKVPDSEVVITKKEHLKAMLSQDPVSNGSAVADPRREMAEYSREVVPMIAAVMGHSEPTPTDRSAGTQMWNYRIPIDDARTALKFYANGGGDQYRKPLPNGKHLNGYNLAREIKEWLANGKPKLTEIKSAVDQTRQAIGAMRRLDT